MKYKGTLTKISNNKNNMRTESMDGFFSEFPTVNESFHIVGHSLVEIKGDGFPVRLISTSVVVEIISHIEKSILFKTNSDTKYCLDYK